MKLKWQWFVGGKDMFWVSIIAFIFFVIIFIGTYIIDPIKIINYKVQLVDSDSIKNYAESYLKEQGVTIDKPIVYRFVKYKDNAFNAKLEEKVVLGTFHEWNSTYYIDISVDLYKMNDLLEETVIHETRHMLVEYLNYEDIIDLIKYTEEIASGENEYYNNMFNSGIYLLKKLQSEERK